MNYVADGYVADGYVRTCAALFPLGSALLTFRRAPARPPRSLSFMQPEIVSGSGEPIGWDYVVKGDILELSWKGLPDSELAALRSFFTDTARGSARTFTYSRMRDGFQSSINLRFEPQGLSGIQDTAYNAGSVSVRARVV